MKEEERKTLKELQEWLVDNYDEIIFRASRYESTSLSLINALAKYVMYMNSESLVVILIARDRYMHESPCFVKGTITQNYIEWYIANHTSSVPLIEEGECLISLFAKTEGFFKGLHEIRQEGRFAHVPPEIAQEIIGEGWNV